MCERHVDLKNGKRTEWRKAGAADGAYIPSKSKSIAMENSDISMNDHIASPSSTNLMATLLLLKLAFLLHSKKIWDKYIKIAGMVFKRTCKFPQSSVLWTWKFIKFRLQVKFIYYIFGSLKKYIFDNTKYVPLFVYANKYAFSRCEVLVFQ